MPLPPGGQLSALRALRGGLSARVFVTTDVDVVAVAAVAEQHVGIREQQPDGTGGAPEALGVSTGREEQVQPAVVVVVAPGLADAEIAAGGNVAGELVPGTAMRRVDAGGRVRDPRRAPPQPVPAPPPAAPPESQVPGSASAVQGARSPPRLRARPLRERRYGLARSNAWRCAPPPILLPARSKAKVLARRLRPDALSAEP